MKKISHLWRVVMKNVCFALFGIGSVVLGMIVFTPVLVFVRKPGRAEFVMRRLIRLNFIVFVGIMRVLGLVKVTWNGNLGEATRDGGSIVIANHPSLIDIVIMMSQVENADCIVKSALFKFPMVRQVVRKLYISNDLQGDDLVEACMRSLDAGNTLVIFPEGTRSTTKEVGPMKRGAARIALKSGCHTIPVRIETPDATGLRKGDGMLIYRKDGPIHYDMLVGEPLSSVPFRNMSHAIGARKLTEGYLRAIS